MTELRSGPPALRDYEVGRLSASTAVSHVHEGRHRYGGQQVLVELLLPEVAGGTGVAERLAAAARRAARLRHPAVVATYDVVNETGAAHPLPFLVTRQPQCPSPDAFTAPGIVS